MAATNLTAFFLLGSIVGDVIFNYVFKVSFYNLLFGRYYSNAMCGIGLINFVTIFLLHLL